MEPDDPAGPQRDFTVAVFVADGDQVLLQWHRKLARWLPPGGHIEPDELPDEAAMRETFEETGVSIRLHGSSGIEIAAEGLPRQLVRPAGVQLEDISHGHQHIDLIYFATVDRRSETLPAETGWFGPAEWERLQLTAELRAWCDLAVRSVAEHALLGEAANHETTDQRR